MQQQQQQQRSSMTNGSPFMAGGTAAGSTPVARTDFGRPTAHLKADFCMSPPPAATSAEAITRLTKGKEVDVSGYCGSSTNVAARQAQPSLAHQAGSSCPTKAARAVQPPALQAASPLRSTRPLSPLPRRTASPSLQRPRRTPVGEQPQPIGPQAQQPPEPVIATDSGLAGTQRVPLIEDAVNTARAGDSADETAEEAAVAEIEQPKPRDDVKCYMVERADGSTCVVVERIDGKRWRFEKSSIDFELNCDAESLKAWLEGITNQQLPGLLTLLANEVSERGQGLKDAEKHRDAVRGDEDYDFFGLDGDHCNDKDVERAYRKKSAQLHPDKGGDEEAFDAMRKKYEQIKELRGKTKRKEGGGGIKWDPNSRESMLRGHSELREQVIWITKHREEVDKEVAELESRHRNRSMLMWH
mmetsp:Transcript_24957/g.47813  ORF Transcript_24957/g.47813 Transcript_24957/m.47813 type:complete len:414 (-) Transcript_24957:149-1390(-)